MTEKDLVLKAKDGNVDAFCILYRKYKKKLYNYAFYKLGNSQDAEDAVSDCVLSAFEQIQDLKKAEAFSSWIFRILYCSCTVAIKEQIRQRNTDDIEFYKNIPSFDDSKAAEREDLRRALGILNDEERNIVLLSVVAGLKSKEIAKITGLTAGNVRQKLSRSLSKMKNYLTK